MADVFYELSDTQAHFLRMILNTGIVSTVPQRTAAVLLRLGLIEDARRFSSGDTMQAGGFVLTDEGRAWLYVADAAQTPSADRPTVEQILSCADAYGDARIMASRGRVDRSEVDEARKELRALVERALGAGDTPEGGA